MKNSRGAALITALFIMTLVAIAAAAMSVNLEILIRRTELSINSLQLYNAAEGVQFWAQNLLLENAKKINSTGQTVDVLPQHFGPLPQNGIIISGNLEDMQGRFNLNNLTNQNNRAQFELLLQAVDTSLSSSQITDNTNAVVNWVSNPGSIKSSTQYTEIYSKMIPPYQTAYMPMISPSELLLVSGMTAALYQKLLPFVITLPTVTSINVNTVSVPVFMSLAKSISKQQAVAFIASRPSGGFQNLKQLNQNGILNQINIPTANFTLVSNYFLATAHASFGSQNLTLYSLIQRQKINGRWQVTVLWQAEDDY